MSDKIVTFTATPEPSRRGRLRSVSLRVLAGSAVLVVAASAVAYGLLTDFALITGNRASTGDRTGGPPPVLDVQIAQSVSGRCDQGGLSWQETSIPAVFDQSVSVEFGTHDYWSSYFCVRLNPATSTTDAGAQVSVENLIDTDPTCSTGESAAGDTDCGTEEPGSGEISEILTWSLYGAPADCSNIQASPLSLYQTLTNGAITSKFGIDNGDFIYCVALRLTTNLASDDTRLDTAQTDSATWDWRFNASE